MNLIRIAAIASLTIRDAIRSRLLVALVAVLLLGLVGLPALIQGDGTLFGRLQIILRYALGFAVMVLSIVTLWAACGGVAREIEDRRIYLILAKPVHRHELWLGKWAAIVGLNAALLTLVGLVIAGMLTWTVSTAPGDHTERAQAVSQLLLARERISAQPPTADFEARVREETAAVLRSRRISGEAGAPGVAAAVRRDRLRAALAIAPGQSRSLTFVLPPARLPGQDPMLAFTPASSRPERSRMVILWRFGEGERAASLQTTNYPGLPWKQRIPASAVGADGTLTVTLARAPGEDPAALLLAPDGQPPAVLVPVGGFGMNLARALLIAWCRLAFLAALGLSAGCLLSMPVAVGVSLFVLVVLAASGYVASVAVSGVFYVPHEGPAPEHTWIDTATLRLFKTVNVVTAPIVELDPVPSMAEGLRITWSMTTRALALMAGLYVLVTALAGMALFRRRELG